MAYLEFYHYLWFFIIYAFLGWCCEVVYAVAVTGEFVNRGFLNGPFCPIYGFGAVGVVLALTPLSDNLILLFMGSVLLTSLLEFISGFILEKIFHSKWWDYSDKPFNIGGYVCLAFSLMWGIGCIFVVKLLHPAVEQLVMHLPNVISWTLLTVGSMLLFTDVIVTVIAVVGLNKRLDQLEGIAQRLNNLSSDLGENLSRNTLIILERNEELRAKLGEKRPEIESLLLKQKELLASKNFGHRRLLRAFPKLKSVKFTSALDKLKTELIINIKKGL